MQMDNPRAPHIVKNGISEFDLIKWCEQFVTLAGMFIDVGAHIGPYSVLLSKKCRQVHSFEAQKNVAECLAVSSCVSNCFNIQSYNVALGSHEGTAVLHHFDNGGASVRSNITTGSITGQEVVPMRTLDGYKFEGVDFIRIDVGGHELEVLKGARDTLTNNKFPPIIFEVWDDEWYAADRAAVLTYVEELGYKVHPISGNSTMFLASDHSGRTTVKVEEPPKYDIPALSEQYEAGTLKEAPWDAWHALATHYRIGSKHERAYHCITKGFEASPPEEQIYKFHEELGTVAFYLGKKDEGYDAGDKVVFSPHAPWSARNHALYNQSFYMQAIPFRRVVPVSYELPPDYIGTSASLINRGGGFLLNLRAVNYSINSKGSYIIRDPQEVVRSRNFLLKLDSELNTQNGIELTDKSGIPLYPKNIVGLEDIRLISPTQFECTYLEVNESRTPQICYCEFDMATGAVTKIIPLQVGDELKCEKNWLPFIMDGEIHFVYTISPLRLYRLDKNTGTLSLVKEISVGLPERGHDDFRGSGGLIQYKGGWLGTVHQVFSASPRKYFHRFIWFDAQLTTMKYSKAFFFEDRAIEFNLSLCHSDEGLLIPYSQNDNSSKIGVFGYETLDDWLKL
jgi:FkbM family methyltransferase